MAFEAQERTSIISEGLATESNSLVDMTDSRLSKDNLPSKQSSEPLSELIIPPLSSAISIDLARSSATEIAPNGPHSERSTDGIKSNTFDFSNTSLYPKEDNHLIAREKRDGLPSGRAGQMNFDYQDLQVVSRVYDQAMKDMNDQGMRMQGGEAASLVGNFLANTGMDRRKLVCAEQADFLRARLMANPELRGCSINYCFTKNYEHAFIQMTDARGNSLYLDPWAQKSAQSYPPYPVSIRTNPERIR